MISKKCLHDANSSQKTHSSSRWINKTYLQFIVWRLIEILLVGQNKERRYKGNCIAEGDNIWVYWHYSSVVTFRKHLVTLFHDGGTARPGCWCRLGDVRCSSFTFSSPVSFLRTKSLIMHKKYIYVKICQLRAAIDDVCSSAFDFVEGFVKRKCHVWFTAVVWRHRAAPWRRRTSRGGHNQGESLAVHLPEALHLSDLAYW